MTGRMLQGTLVAHGFVEIPDAHRPHEAPRIAAHPPRARRPPLCPRRVAVTEQTRADPDRWPLREWVVAEQAQDRAIALQEADQERHEPALAVVGRERKEPHQPVQPEVIGRALRRPPARVARLALELVLAPLRARPGIL